MVFTIRPVGDSPKIWKKILRLDETKFEELKALEQFCLEEWAKVPVVRCAKHIETYPKRLAAVIAAKGVSTKYWLWEG